MLDIRKNLFMEKVIRRWSVCLREDWMWHSVPGCG